MKIVFFGTPDFAADIFLQLLDRGVEIAAVVTKPDKVKGRSGTPSPPPLKVAALQRAPQIPIYQPELASAPEFAASLAQHQADLFIVVAYGEIIKQHLLDMPKLGCINVHGSLLPKYRGAAPIQRCLIEGESQTGVTIMHMVRKMDAGDIIELAKMDIPPDMTAAELEPALRLLGAAALLEVIAEFERGVIRHIPQDASQVTYAAKIEQADGEILWDRAARQLHNLMRGVTPHPGAWCTVLLHGQVKRLKLFGSHFVAGVSGKPGQIMGYDAQGMLVACGSDGLRIAEVQPEGKRKMTAQEFILGYAVRHLTKPL